ncbi:FAD-dependent oxidoreductase [Paraburkholderia sp. 2C]|jgi:3-phenylpropionate/trans-cinnamate dioxygenase ferredoxin reductase component
MTDATAGDAAADSVAAATIGMPRTIAVIGGGQAAGWIVKTLRKEGFGGRIVMIADEMHLPYERPPLSKAVLAGDAGIDTVRLVTPDDFAALNVEAWQPERAMSIDRAQRLVRTASGREVHYDRLVMATGGAPRRLPDTLVSTSHLTYLRTLDDALALGERLRASKRVLVVGGGWIGLEVAATARKLGVEATVIEGATRLCARSVPPLVSSFLLDLHRAHGANVHLDAALASLADHPDDASRVRATLADGTVLDADFAVAGIGLAPHTALAEAAGLTVADGVVVDAFGATSDAHVFACGDVANHPNAWLGRRVRLESWANAQNQAIATARAMLGKPEPYADIPWFWSDQYDVNLQILGDVPTDAPLLVRGDLAARRAMLFYLEPVLSGGLDRGLLRGAIAINNPRELKLARKWMNQGRVVELAALADAQTALA